MEHEFGYLISAIKREQANWEQLWASHVEKYQSRYGEKWREHGPELVTEYENAFNEELERKGLTAQRLHALLLERIAPLVPSYRQIPRVKQMVHFLEESAAGRGEEAAKVPLQNDLS
jgi:hypothetical protein